MMEQMMENMSSSEMIATTGAGTLFVVGIIYTLALSGDDVAAPASMEALETVSYNLVDAAFPLTGSDVVSVAVGEAIAGVVGAAASFGISLSTTRMPSWRSSRSSDESTNTTPDQQQQQQQASSATTTTSSSSTMIKASDAWADGDFLLTQAAALPLLASIGLSPVLLTLTSTVLALVPYEIIKVGARRREGLRREDQMLQQMLLEQQQQQQRKRAWPGGGRILLPTTSRTNAAALRPPEAVIPGNNKVVDLATLSPVVPENKKQNLEPVETVADILKWLQFSVLTSEFGGEHLTLWQGQEQLPGFVESAILGSVAGVSSQFYSDILYAFFNFGGEAKQNMVRSRSVLDWLNLYSAKTIYFAVLFGVYQAVQAPAQEFIAVILSGGAEACYGSDDVRACIETYVSLNPPGASPEAQLRSSFTTAVSLWNNYGVPGWFSSS